MVLSCKCWILIDFSTDERSGGILTNSPCLLQSPRCHLHCSRGHPPGATSWGDQWATNRRGEAEILCLTDQSALCECKTYRSIQPSQQNFLHCTLPKFLTLYNFVPSFVWREMEGTLQSPSFSSHQCWYRLFLFMQNFKAHSQNIQDALQIK